MTFPVVKSDNITQLSLEALAKMPPLGLHLTQLISPGLISNKFINIELRAAKCPMKKLNRCNSQDNIRSIYFTFMDGYCFNYLRLTSIKNLDNHIITSGCEQISVAFTNIDPACVTCVKFL